MCFNRNLSLWDSIIGGVTYLLIIMSVSASWLAGCSVIISFSNVISMFIIITLLHDGQQMLNLNIYLYYYHVMINSIDSSNDDTVYHKVQEQSHRVMYYVLPSTLLAFTINIPRSLWFPTPSPTFSRVFSTFFLAPLAKVSGKYISQHASCLHHQYSKVIVISLSFYSFLSGFLDFFPCTPR